MTDTEMDVLTLYLSKNLTTLDSIQLTQFKYLLHKATSELKAEEERRAK